MLDNIISEYFISNKKENQEHKDRFYPTLSSAFVDHISYKKLEGKCLRMAYYMCMGFKEDTDIPVSNKLVMKTGDYVENMLLDIFESNNILVDKGVKFEVSKYKLYGKIDGILNINNSEVGLEIKTIGSNPVMCSEIFGSQAKPGFPKWTHLFQTLLYCYAFIDRLSKFKLLYIRRDFGSIKEFDISIEPIDGIIYPLVNGVIVRSFTVNDILKRYILLDNFIKSNTVPPREYQQIYNANDIPSYVYYGILTKRQADNYKVSPFGDKECRICTYRTRCAKDR